MEYLELLWRTHWGQAVLIGVAVPVVTWTLKAPFKWVWRALWRPALPDGVSKDMLEREKRPKVERKPRAKKPMPVGSYTTSTIEIGGITPNQLEGMKVTKDRADREVGMTDALPGILLRSRIRQGITYPELGGGNVGEFNDYMMSDAHLAGNVVDDDLIQHNLNVTPGMEERNAAELAKKHERYAARRGLKVINVTDFYNEGVRRLRPR